MLQCGGTGLELSRRGMCSLDCLGPVDTGLVAPILRSFVSLSDGRGSDGFVSVFIYLFRDSTYIVHCLAVRADTDVPIFRELMVWRGREEQEAVPTAG